MGYSFRSGLHACSVDQSVVLVDIPADRYFAVTGAMGAACLRLAAGEDVTSGDDVLIATMIKRQIICQSPGFSLPILCPPAPDILSSEGFDSGGSPKFDGVAMAVARELHAIVELRMKGFEHVLGKVVRQKNNHISASVPGLSSARAARTFAAVDRIIGSHGRCLPRSVALARALIFGGSEPLLILGVKLRPFEAHCWVQVGNRLVGDDPGRVAPFTPILTI